MEVQSQKIETLGKSIKVPNVQELAKGPLDKVPERYIQLHHDTPVLGFYDELQIPVINMENMINGDSLELEKLHEACQQWGFFQIVNHGIDKSLVDKVNVETQQFFKLPLEEKKKYAQTPNDVEGYGQAFVVSEDQKLDWADTFIATIRPKHLRRPHLLPMFPLPYRVTLENYAAEMEKIVIRLLECMSKALKIDAEILRSRLYGDEGLQSFRMNYYPPCPQPEKVIGISPHSDAVSLTVLLQNNEIEGLQIWKDDKWVLVTPLPNAFIVNVGDVLEIATNGLYRSILHRSVVNATRERITIATFHMPAVDKEVGPIPEIIAPGTSAKFKNITVADYYKGYFSRALDDKAYLDVMRIDHNEN